MRDARKIKERNETGNSPKLGMVAVFGVVTALVSYNVGLQSGLARNAENSEAKPESAQPLAAIDTAQKKHDAMQFYTRLTQQEIPAPAPAAPAEPAQAVNPDHAEPNKVETAKDAIARIVEPEPKAAHEPQPKAEQRPQAFAAGDYTVQVSAFQTSEEAEAYKASLTRKGYDPYVIPAEIAGKGVWYRVRVGRYETKNKANEAKAQLAMVNIPSFVVEAN
jgi:cell division protein FtsN